MRRINLLPASYLARRRHRRRMAVIAAAGVVVLLTMVAWRFTTAAAVAAAEDELSSVRSTNASLAMQISELEEYDAMLVDVQSRAGALLTVFEGDVEWPSVLNDVALLTPEDVWLESLTASAGTTEGATQVGTETAEIQQDPEAAFGRIAFQGKAMDMRAVARWLISLRKGDAFQEAWLNSASREEGENGREVVNFDGTVELNPRASRLLADLYELAGREMP